MKYMFFLLLFIAGCELIRIGPNRSGIIIPSRETSIGSVYLFKAELDSNNSHAAVQMLAKSDGTKYLARERYEMQSEMERLGRILANRTISLYRTDTLQNDAHRIILEFDYLKTYIFTTKKIDNQWYIVDIKNDKQ